MILAQEIFIPFQDILLAGCAILAVIITLLVVLLFMMRGGG